jgi:membrane protein DedA with SNARE-associated domain
MITVGVSGGVVIGAVLLGAIVLAYLLGRRVGRRAERRRWEHRIAGEARKLGRARDAVRRALPNDRVELDGLWHKSWIVCIF